MSFEYEVSEGFEEIKKTVQSYSTLDLNKDGVLDSNDFVLFMNSVLAASRDGIITIGEILNLLALFTKKPIGSA